MKINARTAAYFPGFDRCAPQQNTRCSAPGTLGLPPYVEKCSRFSCSNKKGAVSGAFFSSSRPASVSGNLEIVQDRRTRVEGHARGPGRARIIARTVPAAL